MLQIQTFNMNFGGNLFSFMNKTSVIMIRDLRGPQKCPLAKPLRCPFKHLYDITDIIEEEKEKAVIKELYLKSGLINILL